jgi:hypothetical protein
MSAAPDQIDGLPRGYVVEPDAQRAGDLAGVAGEFKKGLLRHVCGVALVLQDPPGGRADHPDVPSHELGEGLGVGLRRESLQQDCLVLSHRAPLIAPKLPPDSTIESHCGRQSFKKAFQGWGKALKTADRGARRIVP